jgi:hypothetical protein
MKDISLGKPVPLFDSTKLDSYAGSDDIGLASFGRSKKRKTAKKTTKSKSKSKRAKSKR